MIITSVPVYLFTIIQQCEQIKKNIQHLHYKTMSVGLMHGRPDNPRFSPFSFAFELSLILIRMFSNAEDQSSFICRQHDTFFLTWIWKFSLLSTFCDIYTLSKKKIDEHLNKPYAFCPRIQWTQIKLPLSFRFYIYTFINYFPVYSTATMHAFNLIK